MIALSHANTPAISTEPFVGESAIRAVRAIVSRCTSALFALCTFALPELTLAMIALSHANPPAISTEPFVGVSAYQGR